jgi:hypothetical protein
LGVDRAEALRSVQTRLRLAVDVADLLGISPTTLRRLRERDPDNFGPSFAMWFRGIQLYLYDGDAIGRIALHLKENGGSGLAPGARRHGIPTSAAIGGDGTAAPAITGVAPANFGQPEV